MSAQAIDSTPAASGRVSVLVETPQHSGLGGPALNQSPARSCFSVTSRKLAKSMIQKDFPVAHNSCG
jgi:hypothetical protein